MSADPMDVIEGLIATGKEVLAQAGIDRAERDARWILAARMNVSPDRVMQGDPADVDHRAYHADLSDRAAGKPVAKIIGRKAFWTTEFEVSTDVLDPRPETESLIDAALKYPFSRVLDLGTGSGCIILTLLGERQNAVGVGSDISAAALKVAKRNSEAAGCDARVSFVQSDWFTEIEGTFDLVVSNPPYIARAEMSALSPEVTGFDPHIALTDGADGLTAYRAICADVVSYLKSSGWLMVEIGHTQGPDVAALFELAGLKNVAVLPDLDGRDRVVIGQAS